MQYLGGKSREGKHILKYLPSDRTLVWEPFCGGGGMTTYLASRYRVAASDAHPALIHMWQAVLSGWSPPKAMTREEYCSARDLPDENPLKAFAGFGVSFSGKYFGGYAKDRPEWRYCEGSRSVVLRQAAQMRDVQVFWADFLEIPTFAPPPGFFIYCDPPYAGTTGYSTHFDSAAFWRKARDWAQYCPVYVSEFTAPEGVRCVWEYATYQGTGKKQKVERLFLLEPCRG